jgi:hypothetical protein
MKLLLHYLLFSAIMLSIMVSLHAITPAKRTALINLRRAIESGDIKPEDIWSKIRGATEGMPENEKRTDGTIKEINKVAVKSLESAKYTLPNGNLITVNTNIALLSQAPVAPKNKYMHKEDNDVEKIDYEQPWPGSDEGSVKLDEGPRVMYQPEQGQQGGYGKGISLSRPAPSAPPLEETASTEITADFESGRSLLGPALPSTRPSESKDENAKYSAALSKFRKEYVSLDANTLKQKIEALRTQYPTQDVSVDIAQVYTYLGVLNKLDQIENGIKQARTGDAIAQLYKDFYETQSLYFTLKIIGEVDQKGSWFWRTPQRKGDQSSFATKSAQVLSELVKKEDSILGRQVIQLTEAESKKFLEEINQDNPIEAFKKQKIDQKRLMEIIETRNEAFYWWKLLQKTKVNQYQFANTDLKAIEKTVAKVKVSLNYQGEWTKSLSADLENFLGSPQVQVEQKKLAQALGNKDLFEREVKGLEHEISTATQEVRNKKPITTMQFKESFEKILTLLSNLEGVDKGDADKKARSVFVAFTQYVGVAVEAAQDKFNAYLKQKAELRKGQQTAKAQAEVQQLGAAYDKDKDIIKELTKQYKSFTQYIFKTESATETTNAADAVDPKPFIEVLNNIRDRADRLVPVFELLVQLRTQLMNINFPLARDEYAAITNFARYKNIINRVKANNLLNENDLQKVISEWNQLQTIYCEQLLRMIEVYRTSNDLPGLHRLTSGTTKAIAASLEELIPANPLKVINQELEDLNDFLILDNQKELLKKIQDGLFENFVYMLIAFDSFSYALLAQGVKPDPANSWYAWFWGLFGYELIADTAQDFAKKNSDFINKFMTKIVNSITLYENSILAPFPRVFGNYSAYRSYSNSTLNVLSFLKERNGSTEGLVKDGVYSYKLLITNPIKFSGGKEVYSAISDLNALHKKTVTYDRLERVYAMLIATAYEDEVWREQAKVDQIWKQIQELAQKHDRSMQTLQAKRAELTNKQSQSNTLVEVGLIEQELLKLEREWKGDYAALMDEYKKKNM